MTDAPPTCSYGTCKVLVASAYPSERSGFCSDEHHARWQAAQQPRTCLLPECPRPINTFQTFCSPEHAAAWVPLPVKERPKKLTPTQHRALKKAMADEQTQTA